MAPASGAASARERFSDGRRIASTAHVGRRVGGSCTWSSQVIESGVPRASYLERLLRPAYCNQRRTSHLGMLLDSVVTPPAPEEGQLVSVRDRHWIVKSVLPSALPTDIMSAGDGHQHLVQLSSVEDDGLGEELSVIWEIEPGTRVLETANLPTPIAGKFDHPARLKTFLDAVRWGAVTSADSEALQAPFRPGITIEDYPARPRRSRARDGAREDFADCRRRRARQDDRGRAHPARS